jgi:8-oxo-dGTP pyrophosphatase MutT (NUDIX family)
LADFARDESVAPLGRRAAVAVTVVRDSTGDTCVLVTRRTTKLRTHAGQFAIPGGAIDLGESSEQAARRELAEELGLQLTAGAVCGLLDDYVTRSGYCITPVVVWAADEPVTVHPNPDEVASTFFVPLRELATEPRFHHIPESTAPVIQLPILGTLIHAPTAAVLFQFAELVVHARTTRVSSFEQPLFAWR